MLKSSRSSIATALSGLANCWARAAPMISSADSRPPRTPRSALESPILSASGGAVTTARPPSAKTACAASTPASTRGRPQRSIQAATRIEPGANAAAAQLALAPAMNAWTSTISSAGAAQQSSKTSADCRRLRKPSHAAPPISTANGTGPKTPNWLPMKPSASRAPPFRAPQAASCCRCPNEANRFTAFQIRFGAASRVKAQIAARIACQVQARRASLDNATWAAMPIAA